MSQRWPGGVVRAIPVTPTGPFQTGTAPGIWTVEQANYWLKQGLWPIAGNSITQLMATLATGNFGGGYNLALDTAGNAYLVGATNISGANSVNIFKFNSTGTLLWQKSFTAPLSGTIDPFGFGIDNSRNVYLVATYSQSPVRSLIMKIDTDGNLVWQRLLSVGATTISCTGLAVDSSGNSYVGGYVQVNNAAILIKYDTNGTLVWQNITAPSSGYTLTDIALDTSGNIYASGIVSGNGIVTFKFNSSGTIQWVRNLSNGNYGSGVAVDTSGNAYTVGWSNQISNYGVILAKYDTSGTLQWQKRLGSLSGDRSLSVCLDTSGNPYILGYVGTGNSPYSIARYDPSGTLQWQRTLDTGGPGNGGIAIDVQGNVVVCCAAKPSGASSSNTLFFTRLPSDGSKTGTRTVGSTTVVYSSSGLQDNTATLSTSSPTTTTQSGGATDAAGSSTLSTLSITPSVVTI